MPGALTPRDCIVGPVRVTRHLYEVPGWGVGEVWARDGDARPARARVEECGSSVDERAASRRPAPDQALGPPRGSEAPSTNATGDRHETVPPSCRICAGASRAPRRDTRPPTTTSRSISTGRRRCSASSPRPRARFPGARSSRTASSPRWPGGRGRRAPPGRSAPRTGTRSSSPATASSRRTGSAATAPPARR